MNKKFTGKNKEKRIDRDFMKNNSTRAKKRDLMITAKIRD